MPDQTVDVSGDEERGVNEAPVPGRAVLRRGQELFLYAWVFSLLGTWWELALEHSVRALTTGDPWSSPVGGWSFVQFAEPYGLGAVAVILVVVPLKERGLSAPLVFLLGAAITAAIEAACAAILVLTVGSNPFWDYSAYPSSLGVSPRSRLPSSSAPSRPSTPTSATPPRPACWTGRASASS